MSEDRAMIINEIQRGYEDGVKSGNLWKVGEPDVLPNPSESSGYKDGFKQGFDEKKNIKAPLAELPVGNLGPVDGVDYAKMEQAFIGDGDVSLSKNKRKDDGPDDFEFDINQIDEEVEEEPRAKKQKKEEGGGGKTKNAKPSKKAKKSKKVKKSKKAKQSKKSKRSRKQKK